MSDSRIEQRIRDALHNGEATGWFEDVYAGPGRVPWALMQPHHDLIEWARREHLHGAGRAALVVGCGLGDDAEALARLGFDVIAFDIAPTAIQRCRERFPDSPVDYRVLDLFDLPHDWLGRFDFALESRTLQALPWDLCEPAIAAMCRLIAPGGTLLVLCHGRDPHEDRRGIPWPLSRDELAAFETYGLYERQFEDLREGRRRFRVTYGAPDAD